VDKEYLALLAGKWRGGSVTVDLPLRRDVIRGGERRVETSTDGRTAVSHFKPLRRFAEATLVSVTLETGRTHQIRAHAASIGRPIAGDTRYGNREFSKWCRSRGLKRMFLHAARLSFVTPETGRQDLEAPIPADLAGILENLIPC
jgi:23S rRNA pseudouridine955/2504/2580 synthase